MSSLLSAHSTSHDQNVNSQFADNRLTLAMMIYVHEIKANNYKRDLTILVV